MLLVLALVLSAVLAYQAQDAARSHRRTAEGTLRDYASFAGWQLEQQAKNGLLTTVITSLSFPASRVDPARLDATVASPAEVERTARATTAWCRCLHGVHYFFRYDWRDGAFRTTETTLPDDDLAWARDTIVAYARALPRVVDRQPTTFGSPDGRYGPLRQLAVVLTNDSYAMVFGERPAPATRGASASATTDPRLLVFVVVRDREGAPVVIYGYETDPHPFVAPVFGFVHRRNVLLPPSLVRGLPPDSILSISATTLLGQEIYRSPARVNTVFAAADTIESAFGRLVLGVGLRPEVADRLVVGGLPHERLPVLVGVFLLTAGLLVVALVQLRRQQELARLRTEFVSGVSHELRTPLAQIRWFAELLHMGRLRSEEERSRSASIIDQEARRLTYLVENVLNFARGEKGTNRVVAAPVDLDREVREAAEAFAPLARARRSTIRTDVAPGLQALADRDALRQVLLNLLDNAAKYGPPGGTIVVGASGEPDGSLGEGMVKLWVEDEGPGIPRAERFRVWEPYVRLGRESEGATGGSGIGLSVVRELVTLHGGRARVESAHGGGARIVVELPAVRESRREA